MIDPGDPEHPPPKPREKKESSCSEYNREVVLVLGVDTEGPRTILGKRRLNQDQQAYKDAIEFFDEFTLAELRLITFAPNTTERIWLQRMKEELESCNAGDLVIIIFAGDAGMSTKRNQSYSVTLRPYPLGGLNFYKIFAMIDGCEARKVMVKNAREDIEKQCKMAIEKAKEKRQDAPGKMDKTGIKEAAEAQVESELHGLNAKVECDILLIFDTTFPDKITHELKREKGVTTVFTRGMVKTDARGKITQADGNFLSMVVDSLYLLTKDSNTKYGHYTTNHTVAQAVSNICGKEMSSYAQQCFSDDFSTAGSEKLVSRPVLDISSARETGKMQFLREYCQGQPPELDCPTRMDRCKLEAKLAKLKEEDESKSEDCSPEPTEHPPADDAKDGIL